MDEYLAQTRYVEPELGKQMMDEAIRRITTHYGPSDIRISAQSYLEKFYRLFGFVPTGKEYLEDEIPHMEMLRAASTWSDI